MPIGAVGAVTAANRANRNRNNGMSGGLGRRTPCKPTTACRYSSTVAASKPAAAPEKETKAADITETASVDSKPSVFSMFSKQVNEAGGFFKKQKDALAEKVQKGLKLTTSKKESDAAAYTAFVTEQKAAPAAASPAVPVQKSDLVSGLDAARRSKIIAELAEEPVVQPAPAAAVPVVQKKTASGVAPAWIDALGQMGFDASQVEEAAAMVGGQPAQMDDLLQVLVAMNASNEPVAPSPILAEKSKEELPKAKEQPPLPPPVSAPPPPSPPKMPAMSAACSVEFVRPSGPAGMSAVGSAEFEMAADRHRSLQPPMRAVPQHLPQVLTPSALQSLQQMGFNPEMIHQARLRNPNASFDQLFDSLLSMGAILSPPNSGGAGSSSDPAPGGMLAAAARINASLEQAVQQATPQRTLEEEADLCSPNTASELVAELVEEVALASLQEALSMDACRVESEEAFFAAASAQDADGGTEPELVLEMEPESETSSQGSLESPMDSPQRSKRFAKEAEEFLKDMMEPTATPDFSNRDIAKAVVSLVLARASETFQSQDHVSPQPKIMAEERFTASPVKGGA